jgi:hypothetical protein
LLELRLPRVSVTGRSSFVIFGRLS